MELPGQLAAARPADVVLALVLVLQRRDLPPAEGRAVPGGSG